MSTNKILKLLRVKAIMKNKFLFFFKYSAITPSSKFVLGKKKKKKIYSLIIIKDKFFECLLFLCYLFVCDENLY